MIELHCTPAGSARDACDLFPVMALARVPLHDPDLLAEAVRVLLHLPPATEGLEPHRDIDDQVLRGIAIAARKLHDAGESVDVVRVLDRLEGVDRNEAADAWLWYDLGDPTRVDPTTVTHVRQLAWWRRQREACLRAAVACERMDLGGVIAALDGVAAQVTRADAKRKRSA